MGSDAPLAGSGDAEMESDASPAKSDAAPEEIKAAPAASDAPLLEIRSPLVKIISPLIAEGTAPGKIIPTLLRGCELFHKGVSPLKKQSF
jgi:hypothetical protein